MFAACAANIPMLYSIDDSIKEEEDKEEDKEDEDDETVERTTLLQCYVDADPNETYYVLLVFEKERVGPSSAVCGGERRSSRVLNCKKKDFCGALVGHGG